MKVLVVGSGGVGESTAAIAKRRDPKGEVFEKMVMADYDLAKAQAVSQKLGEDRFPAEQVSAIVKVANREKIPFTARGAGTGLSGGTVADQGGIMLAMSRMKKIEIDAPNLQAIAQPGAVNYDISIATAPYGL